MSSTASLSRILPYFTAGVVIKGFGRGSKELEIPTANFSDEVVAKLPGEFPCGVYYGWAQVGLNGKVHKMVMSIGWNPFYKNVKKSMETHIMHEYENDFYGELLRVAIMGYIRPERSFQSKDDLIKAIRDDIEKAKVALDEPQNVALTENAFFKAPGMNGIKL